MKKNKIILDDGRYLVYYTFGKDNSKSPKAGNPREAKGKGGKR